MKKLLLFFIFCAISVQAQSIVKRDNGVNGGYYSQPALYNFEESVILKPDGPCKINKVMMYMGGSAQSVKDTIWIVGDPAEGTLAPTQYVWSYNTLANAIVDYQGKPGWVEVDLSSLNIRSDGYDRICIQHTNEPGGPRFAIDKDSAAFPISSFLYDPLKINSQSYPGVYSYAQGDFMVRLEVTYDFPKDNTSDTAPYPSLLDITQQAGLVGSDGKPVKSSRVSVADWNNDGFDDVIIGSDFFKNNGDGTFKNLPSIPVTASATVWGDMNNDGWLDIYAVDGDGDKIYKNNGDNTFTNITVQTGISNPMPTITPIWLDYNRDGNLDIFIANGSKIVAGKDTFFPDQLWKNNGDGTFKNVTAESKISLGEPAPLDCWGASACDYNNDGWVDIFVATSRFAADKLFKNNGNGTFTEVGAQTGVIGNPTTDSKSFGDGVGCDWGDYDNDGFMDLAVGNLGNSNWYGSVSNPSLVFKNNGGENFTEVHEELGIKFFEMNSGVMWADLDLDGNLDLWHSQYAENPAGGDEPQRLSRVYMNGGAENNYAFKDKTWELGAEIHGAWTQARTDFDNDGDIDILAASPHDGVRLFRNDMERKGNWIGFKLGSDIFGNSTKFSKINNLYDVEISLHAGNRIFTQKLYSGGSGATATQNSNGLNFGLGNIDTVDYALITYKGKQFSLFSGKPLPVNFYCYLREDTLGSLEFNTMRLPTPAQIYPRNTQKLSGTEVTLKLTNNLGARVEIGYDSTFASLFDYPFTGYGDRIIKNLPKNTTLYWRARNVPSDTPRESPWSSVWSFTTGNATSVENEIAFKNDLLKEATPNPVLNKTTIDFTIEKAGAVSLKIFDLDGHEIATLTDGAYEPGDYSKNWNAENIPSGTYYYILKTAAGSVSKKLVVQK
ncbi:MAG: T9SS type A sorting domain-containing protein [Bacteroidota bacterium]